MKVPFYEPLDYRINLSRVRRGWQLLRRVCMWLWWKYKYEGRSPLPNLYVLTDPTCKALEQAFKHPEHNPFEPEVRNAFAYRGYQPWRDK